MTEANGDPTNGRTHEPALRQLTAEVDGLRMQTHASFVALREIMDERDRLYTERDDARKLAVDAALAAAKEAVAAALLAADRAVSKVETANEKRFESVNEFRGQLADQAVTFMPRNEANIRFDGLAEKHELAQREIQGLRETRSQHVGASEQQVMGKQDNRWLLGVAMGVPSFILAVIAAVLALAK